MRVGVPNEAAAGESRVALVPAVAESLIDAGHEVSIVAGAGTGSDVDDADYATLGCDVLATNSQVYDEADVVLRLTGLADPEAGPLPYSEGQTVVGLLDPYALEDELATLAERNVTAFALELMPRISRAQRMDALSSMASIGGYKSVVRAAELLPKMFPMEMTAAGTVQPAEVFVVGAGVAGLKAVATAGRMGASVRAYDIRLEVKTEVESLGADFVTLDLETEGSGDEEGYAREMDEEFYRQQRRELSRVVADSDVVITTAAIPGRPAPELVSTEMIESMDPGSIIVDLSAESGGNCEPTQAGETIEHDGVTIDGPTNLPQTVSHTASQLMANNFENFLTNLLIDGELTVDTDDEIVDSTLLTHAGTQRFTPPSQDDETGERDSADADSADSQEGDDQ